MQEEILYNPELAYEHLDENYKKAKFANLNEFKIYAINNSKRYVTAKVTKYQKTEKNGYIQYACTDTEGRVYIFNETAVKKYTLILDTYTLEIPEFTAKYNTSNPKEKVILNLDKFMQSINDKDYKYAYSLLAESFKNLNFKTQAEFENYMKTNFFEKNKFEYEKFGDEANTYYTYKIKITDKTGIDEREITKTFIILLEEGTKFKLSFDK
ncbi:MAG: hypothetical protein HFJ50_09350 [Clostridia bacterium]|nr:hypothetical protein [Clostridia bacterium]